MSKLEPGRDLDARIAAEIFHLEIKSPPESKEIFEIIDGWDGSVKNNSTVMIRDGLIYRIIPAYSTSIEAAWEIVEKMEGRFFRLGALRSPSDDTWTGFMCEMGDVQICAKTAPLAIALAGLRAVNQQP